MDFCRGVSSITIVDIIMAHQRTQLNIVLLIIALLSSFSCFAADNAVFSLINTKAFLLGLSLPLLVCFIWKLLCKPKSNNTAPQDINSVSSEELFSYTHDLVTNLPTAQHALKKFNQVLKISPSNKYAAIVFKPINFQQVNKVLGHHNSDILLLQLAFCLKKNVEQNPSLLSFECAPEVVKVARLQGLDFLVVYDVSSSKHAPTDMISSLCQQLAQAVPNAMSFKSFSLNFELAFGVAITGEHGCGVNETVAHATDALLKATMSNQSIEYFDNSAVLYTEKQLRLMERLRQDILSENLRWQLQPQVNIKEHALVGFELTVNWLANENEPLELTDFIDLAEHSGELYLLTKQMFKQAFKALFSLHKLGVYQRVSVNLANKNVLEPDLVDYIEQQMTNYNIAGKYVMIELNEKIMLSACQQAKNIIDQLKSLDIGIAINNFSGSYESLRYLRKMAVHQVKIDCQELESSADNQADQAIVNTLITLTGNMKLPLIGTHIDNQETAHRYTSMGGNLLQGSYIDVGIAPDAIEAWLSAWFAKHPASKPQSI